MLDLADETPEGDIASRRRVAGMLLAHGSPQDAAELFEGRLDDDPGDAQSGKGLADARFDPDRAIGVLTLGDVHRAYGIEGNYF